MENKNLNQSDGVEVSIKPTTSSQEEDLDVATLASLSPGTHVITRTYSSQLVGNITVKLPSGVTLIFQGGKIEKGSATALTIQGNDTAIQAPITQIFGEGVSASGTWLIDRAFPQWFDEKVGKESWLVNIAKKPHNCADAINKAIKMKQVGEVFLTQGKYFISTPIIMTHGIQLIGEFENRISKDSYVSNNDTWANATWLIPFVWYDGTNVIDEFKETVKVKLPYTQNGQPAYTTKIVNSPVIRINCEQTGILKSMMPLEIDFSENVIIPAVVPSGMIKNLNIYNELVLKTSDNKEEEIKWIPMLYLAQRECCVVGGAFTFENVVFKNFLRAVRWIKGYFDSKRIIHSIFNVTDRCKEDLTEDSYLIDMGDLGDGLQILSCQTDHNIQLNAYHYKALRVGRALSGSISDNILNTDVTIEGASALTFNSNHLESGAQLLIVNSNMAVRNNFFEKGARPNIVIDTITPGEERKLPYGETKYLYSQLQITGNTFLFFAPTDTTKTVTNDDKTTTIVEKTDIDWAKEGRTPIKSISEDDIALCALKDILPYSIQIVQNFRISNNKDRSNQPTGIILSTFTTDDGTPPSSTTTRQSLAEFNNYSYFLSTDCFISRGGNIVANRNFNQLPKATLVVNSSNEVRRVDKPDVAETASPYLYSAQLILDINRKIASSVMIVEEGTFNPAQGNAFRFNWDDNLDEQVFLLRIARMKRDHIGLYTDFVDIPVIGTKTLRDNYFSIDGYRWQPITNFPFVVPANIEAVEFKNNSIRAFGNQCPDKTGWRKHDIVINTAAEGTSVPVLWYYNGTNWQTR